MTTKGHIHQAHTRRLFGGLKITGIMLACCFGATGLMCLVRVATGGTIPPHVWARKVDQQTREEVEATLTEGFNIAHNSAPHQLNDALREATFHVPHELARLNKDAPDFRLEDLGPMVHAKEIWDKLGKRFPSFAPFIDCGEETRVFLYFPNGATKATAIFVAVNAELEFPLHRPVRLLSVDWFKRVLHATVETTLLQMMWGYQHRIWARNHPAVTGRIEGSERLPVIFNFREKAFGVMYYTRLDSVLDSSMSVTPLITTDLNRGILSP